MSCDELLTVFILITNHCQIFLINPVGALDLDLEDGVGSGALVIHVGGPNLPRLLTLLHSTETHQ